MYLEVIQVLLSQCLLNRIKLLSLLLILLLDFAFSLSLTLLQPNHSKSYRLYLLNIFWPCYHFLIISWLNYCNKFLVGLSVSKKKKFKSILLTLIRMKYQKSILLPSYSTYKMSLFNLIYKFSIIWTLLVSVSVLLANVSFHLPHFSSLHIFVPAVSSNWIIFPLYLNLPFAHLSKYHLLYHAFLTTLKGLRLLDG